MDISKLGQLRCDFLTWESKEGNVVYVISLSRSLLNRNVTLIVSISEYWYRFANEIETSFERNMIDLIRKVEMQRRCHSFKNDRLAFIIYRLTSRRVSLHATYRYYKPDDIAASSCRSVFVGGSENCLADNRRMWSINYTVTYMSFSSPTRYFHRLPPEVALMGNVDRAQKR